MIPVQGIAEDKILQDVFLMYSVLCAEVLSSFHTISAMGVELCGKLNIQQKCQLIIKFLNMIFLKIFLKLKCSNMSVSVVASCNLLQVVTHSWNE